MVDIAAIDAAQERILDLIARTIADRLHPRRVILIGSRARGDARPDSDYDVVVEIDANAWRQRQGGREKEGRAEFDLINEVSALFPGRRWELNVIPRFTGEIERRADDPGTIDWDILRQGRVLYCSDGHYSLPRPHSSRVREAHDRPPESLTEWVDRAGKDLELARVALAHGGLWDAVCYSSQQAAEKYLKAALVRRYVHPSHTHNLVELLGDLRAAGVSAIGLDADCAQLAEYGVTMRCGPFKANEEIARDAVAAAERVREGLGLGESPGDARSSTP